MPAPVGLAATFDQAAAGSYGHAVGLAGRATDQDVWLGPMINEVNYPTAGRNFETLGEDPYLASQLVAQEVRGVQSTGMIAELKHFIENDFENGRNSTSVTIDDQTLHETELQAFAAGIAAAPARSCAPTTASTTFTAAPTRPPCKPSCTSIGLHRIRAVGLGGSAPDHRPVLRHRHRTAWQCRRDQQLRRRAGECGDQRHASRPGHR